MTRRAAARFGVMADVHSNLQALETALDFLDAEGVDEVWCLGDVVGYGGDPEACIALVRERCAGTVRGNHDAAAVEPALRSGFNPHAREAIERQASRLGEEARAWLAGLPPVIDLGEVLLLHGSAVDPEGFPYVLDRADAARELAAIEARWAFCGHTHVPSAWRREPDGETRPLPVDGAEVAVDAPGRYLLNPGAVGQPRDGDRRAACGVFDRQAGCLRIERLEYDVEAARAAIRRAGMPEIEAERLGKGW